MTAPSLFFSIRNSSKRFKRGVSPVIATTIILAITIVLGLSLWSFANAGVSTATQSYADSVSEFGRFTTDRFVIASVSFDHPANDDLTVWIYNSGKLDSVVQAVVVSCKQCASPVDPVTLIVDDEEALDFTVASKTLEALKLDSSAKGTVFVNGNTYQVQVVTDTGSHQTIYQKDE
jgi:flagellin-like protein